MVGQSRDLFWALAFAAAAADIAFCFVARGGKYLVAPLAVCPLGLVLAVAAFVAG